MNKTKSSPTVEPTADYFPNSAMADRALDQLTLAGSSEALSFLSAVVSAVDHAELREVVIGRLLKLAESGNAQPMFKVWWATRHPRLTALLTEGGWIPDFPSRLKVLRLLEQGKLGEVISGGPDLVVPLVDATAERARTVRERAVQCLEQLHDPEGIDVLLATWAERRTHLLGRLIRNRKLVARTPPVVRVLSALAAGRTEVVTEMGAEAVVPLLQACDDRDSDISKSARATVLRLTNQKAIDELCMIWAHQKREELGPVIETARYVAEKPPLVRALSALKGGRTNVPFDDGHESVYPLVLAAGDADQAISDRAKECLEALSLVPTAQDALCRTFIEHGSSLARDIAVSGGFKPTSPRLQALFYFLTQQWDEYEALDFDMSLLRESYQNAGKALRSRIAAKARRAGRLELVELVAGVRHKRRMGEMTLREWETTIAIIDDRNDWETLWRLAQAAPAVWAARALVKLNEIGWVPARPEEREGYSNLSQRAARCTSEAPILGIVDRPLSRFRAAGRRISDLIINSYFDSSLATGSWDGTLSIWTMPDGEPLKTLAAHRHPLTSLAATPDGSLLASGCGAESAAVIWSMPEGKPVRRLDGHRQGVACLSMSPDGRLLAAGGYDGQCSVWRVRDGALLHVVDAHVGSIRCVQFSPDGESIATGGEDGKIRLYHVQEAVTRSALHGHKGTVRAIAFAPDNTVMASAGYDEDVMLWSIPDGILRKRLAGHRNVVGALAVSGDSRILASGSHDRTVRLWILPEGRPWGTLEEHSAAVTCLATDPESRVLVSGSHDCRVMMWNFQSGIFRRPTTREDMDPVERMTRSCMNEAERNWLDFLDAQMKWRWRFDIEVETGPTKIEIGEFDIEIAR